MGKRLFAVFGLLAILLVTASGSWNLSTRASATDGSCGDSVESAVEEPGEGDGGDIEPPAGDVDCDDEVDSTDALHMLRQTVGMEEPRECGDPEPDFDCDGEMTAVDALKLLRFVAGVDGELERCRH